MPVYQDIVGDLDTNFINVDQSPAMQSLIGALSGTIDGESRFVYKLGDNMNGKLLANTNGVGYTSSEKQVRNITVSSTIPSGGDNGDMWLRY